jgi:2-methylcitrate dehydratase PrpD
VSASHTQTRFDPSASLTSGLVALIRAKRVTDADLRLASWFALDAIANIIGGMASADIRPLLQWAASEPLNTGRRALLLGGAATVLEMDAMHRESAVHAGTMVVPALLAMSHSHPVGGRAFLTALLKGGEAAFRVGRAAGPAHYRTYQNSATCGPFGAAMGCAELLSLSDEEAVHALGNAGTRTGGLWEFRETGAMSKQLHAGGAAEAGVVAAQTAGHHFTGPLRILEGSRGFFKAACPDARPDEVLRDPERPWDLGGSSIKPWPSSRHTHPAIDAALEVAANKRSRTVVGLEIDTYQTALDLCGNSRPASPHQAKSSIAYCAVAAVVDGVVDLGTFTEAPFERHRAMAANVILRTAEPYQSAFPRAWGAQVTAIFDDGTRVSAERHSTKGDPDAPMSDSELWNKAITLLRLGKVERPELFVTGVLNMANDGPVPVLAFP